MDFNSWITYFQMGGEHYMGYESLERDSLVTLKIVLSRAEKTEKDKQFKKDIKYEHQRILKALE